MEIGGVAPGTPEKKPELASAKQDQEMQQVCKEFESIFLSQLLTQMRKNLPKSKLFGEGRDEEMYQDMLAVEQAKAWSESGGIGLANLLYQQFRQNSQ